MKLARLCVLLACLLVGRGAYAQLEPVHWKYAVKKTGGNNYEVHLTATIDEGWHIYAQRQPPKAIALPVRFEFGKNPLVLLTGTVAEVGKKEEYKELSTGIEAFEYSRKVDFVQKINLKQKIKTNFSGKIHFQVCNEEMCLPPKTVEFNLQLN